MSAIKRRYAIYTDLKIAMDDARELADTVLAEGQRRSVYLVQLTKGRMRLVQGSQRPAKYMAQIKPTRR